MLCRFIECVVSIVMSILIILKKKIKLTIFLIILLLINNLCIIEFAIVLKHTSRIEVLMILFHLIILAIQSYVLAFKIIKTKINRTQKYMLYSSTFLSILLFFLFLNEMYYHSNTLSRRKISRLQGYRSPRGYRNTSRRRVMDPIPLTLKWNIYGDLKIINNNDPVFLVNFDDKTKKLINTRTRKSKNNLHEYTQNIIRRKEKSKNELDTSKEKSKSESVEDIQGYDELNEVERNNIQSRKRQYRDIEIWQTSDIDPKYKANDGEYKEDEDEDMSGVDE